MLYYPDNVTPTTYMRPWIITAFMPLITYLIYKFNNSLEVNLPIFLSLVISCLYHSSRNKIISEVLHVLDKVGTFFHLNALIISRTGSHHYIITIFGSIISIFFTLDASWIVDIFYLPMIVVLYGCKELLSVLSCYLIGSVFFLFQPYNKYWDGMDTLHVFIIIGFYLFSCSKGDINA